MSNDILHPTPDRLESYVEGSLGDADRAVLESHLNSCTRCQTEVEELTSLFAALASLPHLEPMPGFADRVMAGVHIHQPWHVRLFAILDRLVPSGRTGWMIAALLVVLPAVTVSTTLAWLFSRPTITLNGLWYITRAKAGEAVLTLGGRLLQAILENEAATWIWMQIQVLVANVGLKGIGAGAALCTGVAAVATWVLYDNLFRTPTRDDPYAITHV